MSIEETWDARWSEELDRRGLTSVVAALSDVGPSRGAEFRLFIADMPNPSRGYVEDWISRKEAEATAIDTKRFLYIFVASVVAAAAGVFAVVVGIIAAWPVIHDWFSR